MPAVLVDHEAAHWKTCLALLDHSMASVGQLAGQVQGEQALREVWQMARTA